MNLCFGLWMSQFFKGHPRNHAIFAIEEEGIVFGFNDGCEDKPKDGAQGKECTI